MGPKPAQASPRCTNLYGSLVLLCKTKYRLMGAVFGGNDLTLSINKRRSTMCSLFMNTFIRLRSSRTNLYGSVQKYVPPEGGRESDGVRQSVTGGGGEFCNA